MNTHARRVPAPPLQAGAQVYSQQLAGQGGHSTQALARLGPASSVAVVLHRSPAYDLVVPALPVSRLSINLCAGHVHGALQGDRSRSFAAPRHSLFLTPAGADAHWRKDEASRHLNLYYDADVFADGLADAVPEGTRWVPHTPLLNARVPCVGAWAQQLALELQQPGPLAAEAADSLARLILVAVARSGGQPRTAANPIHPALLLRLRDHVQAHLGERILVQDLAAVAQLPVNRFAQAFAARVGQPPHRYVLMLRLQHAMHLLQHSKASLADVAASCGFSSQQHLTHTMRLRLGTTPGRFRAGPASVGGQPG